MKRKAPIIVIIALVLAGGIYFLLTRQPASITLTGIVTTDEVIVSSEIQGRMQQLLVQQGDVVTNGQLLATIRPQEQQADVAFYGSSVKQWSAQVEQAEADLKFQESQTSNQITQAEATLASTEAQTKQAESDLENASLTFKREEDLYKSGAESIQAYDQARTSRDGAQARVESLKKQIEAARAAVAMAKDSEQQVAGRRAALAASRQQQDAANAQKDKADVRLDYTQVHAPVAGIVDTRAALQGEVVNPSQAIITLLDPDNLWVRADVEETYIDSIRMGDKLPVRLPSGATREGTVFYRAMAGDYATQRDVSRTKRDIKTFEVRLRCDNHDRALAVGMTAYVTLPIKKP
jgi:multidrug resistance efflux pump